MSLCTPDERVELIAGYRELADWLEAHPDAPLERWQFSPELYTTHLKDEGVERIVKTSPSHVARWMKGGRKVEKESFMGTYKLVVNFRGGLSYKISFGEASVCKPKAVEVVEKREVVCTDEDRAAELRAELDALNETVVVGTETRVLSWECPPSLLKAA